MYAGHPNWDKVADFAVHCSWRAGPHLAELMRNNQFADWERVIAAFSGDDPVGFCTLTAKDEMPDSCDFSPFIGFVFVSDAYRGMRISAQMIDAAAAYAGSLGFHTVYVTSDERGLYEKYGFVLRGLVKNAQNEITQLFAKSITKR